MIQIIPSELKRLYKVLPRLYRLRLLKVGISVFVMAVLDLVGTGVLPLGTSVVPKAFLWGHFWMGEWGS